MLSIEGINGQPRSSLGRSEKKRDDLAVEGKLLSPL